MTQASVKKKVLAGLSFVVVSTMVGILYKVSQVSTGGFKYSTMSAVTMSETWKFFMSCSFHVFDPAHAEEGVSRIRTAYNSAAKTLSGPIVMQILFLSLLYFGNNQLSFFSYTLADPGTIYLFKSGSTFIVATVQTCCGVKTFSCDQWKSLALQACGMIIVQYDPCQNKGRYSVLAYSCMCFSSVITALCAVRNEHMVKNYNVGLNVQNAVLYFGGLCFNLAGFHLLPNPSSKAAVGFFEGYDSVPAVGVVFANSIVGLAISATYKYADAVVKCLASDVTSVLLIIVSVQFFDLKPNITMWCGMGVVTYAVHAYINATTQVVPLKSEKLGKGQDEEATIEMARLIQEPTSEAVPRNIGRSVPAGSNLAEAYSGADFRDRAEVHRKICSSGIELG
eukprot:TRINITY_DN34255_c0_g1_i2.p1 TRINITY_DN34255_c0_g1~~TRINITY_DN34255_c0_g1_i2.p1  ORF type:complete len:394 (-),score=64.61 TRINITY_DN34255_c0_g1_i2:63-1244(-)